MSKYLKAWLSTPSNTFKFVGNISLVEVLPDTEFSKKVKTASGETKSIILSGHSTGRQVTDINANKQTFVQVIQAGEGRYKTNPDGTTEDLPPSYPVGSILLVPADAIKYISTFGRIVAHGDNTKIGIIHEDSVQGYSESMEAFDAYCDQKNEVLQNV